MDFIGICLTRQDFINQALQFQQGTVYERMAVSPDDLLSMTISIPCRDTQNQFSLFITTFEKTIQKHQMLLEQLEKEKRSLLAQIFI